MRILQGKAAERLVRSLEQRGSSFTAIEPAVRKIVEDVRQNGDHALLKYARTFDGLGARQKSQVAGSELRAAWKAAPKELRSALKVAEKNIRRFCEWQKPKEWLDTRRKERRSANWFGRSTQQDVMFPAAASRWFLLC